MERWWCREGLNSILSQSRFSRPSFQLVFPRVFPITSSYCRNPALAGLRFNPIRGVVEEELRNALLSQSRFSRPSFQHLVGSARIYIGLLSSQSRFSRPSFQQIFKAVHTIDKNQGWSQSRFSRPSFQPELNLSKSFSVFWERRNPALAGLRFNPIRGVVEEELRNALLSQSRFSRPSFQHLVGSARIYIGLLSSQSRFSRPSFQQIFKAVHTIDKNQGWSQSRFSRPSFQPELNLSKSFSVFWERRNPALAGLRFNPNWICLNRFLFFGSVAIPL